ncbi:MAG: Smr/MutS family protein [Opitutaceae bacterium]|nr:Smr/MutS family protein [Opitutaceae bacterium]MBP9912797.1 Smr/MutS family protein [Opitutaceae bacterium]
MSSGAKSVAQSLPLADSAVSLPITGELDLHTFRPQDVGELIPAYLEACAQHGLHEIRIVHGKGTGTLRTTVHTLLQRSPLVRTFRLGDERTGGWGATLVTLRS